jgi:hypothetical protein
MDPIPLQQYLARTRYYESNDDETTYSLEDELVFESDQEEFQNDHTATATFSE